MENDSENPGSLKKDLVSDQSTKPKSGLDNWNDRLDENLESEKENNPNADQNAENFSDKFRGNDQSDRS